MRKKGENISDDFKTYKSCCKKWIKEYVKMKNENSKIFKDRSYWIEVFVWTFWISIISFLDIPWYFISLILFISGVMIFILKSRDNQDNSYIEQKIKSKVKKALKSEDSLQIYKFLDEEILSVMRSQIPLRIYKYYSLREDEKENLRKIDTVKKNSIWSSVYSAFNDPFEYQYMYLTKDNLKKIGIPSEGKQLWDSLMEEIRKRVTTICFTENPNSMSMWAHYANEHKGFCIEYEVMDTSNLYPVVYTEKRIQTFSLFIELIYNLFCGEAKVEDKVVIFRYIMLLGAFKDKSWEQEKEIRAIFLNTKVDLNAKGKVFECNQIGVRPVKIYIGVKCNDANRELLISMAKDINIEYKNCMLSNEEKFSVLENM